MLAEMPGLDRGTRRARPRGRRSRRRGRGRRRLSVTWRPCRRNESRTSPPSCRVSAPPSSPRCRPSPWPPGRSTSARASPTPTDPRRCSTPPSTRIRAGSTSTRPGPGMPVLRQAIAAHQQRFYGLDLRPRPRGAGHRRRHRGARRRAARHARHRATRWWCSSPCSTATHRASHWRGRCAKPVLLRPPDVSAFDPDETARRDRSAKHASSSWSTRRTTPPGKVFTMEELQCIADLAIEHDLVVVTDEVYEHLVFDGAQHIADGVAAGHAPSARSAISSRRQDVQHHRLEDRLGVRARAAGRRRRAPPSSSSPTSNGGPFQPAIALGLGLPDSFFHGIAGRPAGQARPAVAGLVQAGFTVYPTSGTYFVTVDIRPVQPDGDGMAFCRASCRGTGCGVVAIPNEVFYANQARTAGTWCGSRSASASRCSTKRSRA
jgi:N-succinyldiaminopimelate aminotransferase